MTTEKDQSHFASKHEPGATPDPHIEAALKEAASGGELPCEVVFQIASDRHVSPKAVGRTADLLEFRLTECQLGLFGHVPEKRVVRPAEHVSEDLKKAIREGLKNGRLPCVGAWDIARRLGLQRMAVSSACEALGVKISSCQIGAF